MGAALAAAGIVEPHRVLDEETPVREAELAAAPPNGSFDCVNDSGAMGDAEDDLAVADGAAPRRSGVLYPNCNQVSPSEGCCDRSALPVLNLSRLTRL